MTKEELEMRKLVRESDVIDKTDGTELAKAFNHLWEKYIEQEPCEDWYDVPSNEMILEQARQASKDLRKRFKEDLEQEPCDEYGNYKYHSDIELTEPNTATSMPCGDAISRQAVLEIAKSPRSNWIDNSVLFKRVNELPSINPTKTGHWIDINSKSYELHRVYKCSECGNTEIEYPESIYRRCRYCPNCGAKMVDEQEI